VAYYRDALRIWRGPALDGIDSQLIRAASSRLDEQHIATIEDRIDLELELGRHRELVGELTELVEAHPLREQLRGQLMLALYRSDRAAEALHAYRETRRTLIDELGIEPSDRLRQLERAMLTSDPVLWPPPQPVLMQPMKRQVPSLLPTDIADFTGRDDQLGRIRRGLPMESGEAERQAVPIVALTGGGGVGKTSLAVHAAHEVVGHFPDGQLFADLHGSTLRSVSPAQVLERFITALGAPPSAIPEGLDERAEMYRNLLAGRKILIVLDDATSESQVVPLLPGRGAAAVIVTSRRRLVSLPGATHVEVTALAASNSVDLLARIAGEGRVRAEARAAAQIAEYCGHLPFALRIAGTRLSARPHWSVQQLVDRLADETRRLDELRHGDMCLRSSISLSYVGASRRAKQLFCRLALLDLPLFSGWMSSALLGLPLDEAEDLLDELVSAQLVEATGTGSGVRSHYRFPELVRVFAREQAVTGESPAEREAALKRFMGTLLYLARQALSRYYGETSFGGINFGFGGDAGLWPLPDRLTDALLIDPPQWFDSERPVLLAAVRQAARTGQVELCWSLAVSNVTLLPTLTYLDYWQETHQIALEAAQKAADVRAQAAMHYCIGSLAAAQQRFDQARQAFGSAAHLFADIGEDQGVALVLHYAAYLASVSGDLTEADARAKLVL
jgi:tetratricopeptide (TPR) repeat protein